MNRKAIIASGLMGAVLVTLLAAGQGAASIGDRIETGVGASVAERGMIAPVSQTAMSEPPAANTRSSDMASDNAEKDNALQALEGLAQIRVEQCQSGNQLACQAVPTIPGIRQQLTGFGQSCRSGDSEACGSYRNLAQRIFTAYSESAAVMRQGAEGMAQMNGWRNRMNANAAASMANLQAMGARGQAAQVARQESYAAMNSAYAAGQASSDRIQGRSVDSIYEGTTMSGGGVQARIDYGRTGYTDGYGNVVTGPEGGDAPYGYQEMNPTYAAPE